MPRVLLVVPRSAPHFFFVVLVVSYGSLVHSFRRRGALRNLMMKKYLVAADDPEQIHLAYVACEESEETEEKRRVAYKIANSCCACRGD